MTHSKTATRQALKLSIKALIEAHQIMQRDEDPIDLAEALEEQIAALSEKLWDCYGKHEHPGKRSREFWNAVLQYQSYEFNAQVLPTELLYLIKPIGAVWILYWNCTGLLDQ